MALADHEAAEVCFDELAKMIPDGLKWNRSTAHMNLETHSRGNP
jgi:hypothetical protein